MTVTTTVSRASYLGDGTSIVFQVPFYFLLSSDLAVYVDDTRMANGYTVAGAGDEEGGSVTFDTAPDTGLIVQIVRDPDSLQNTHLPPNDPFPSKSVETGLDKLTMLVQRIIDRLQRIIQFPDTETSPNGTLPLATERASHLFGFDSLGGITMYPVTASVGAGDLIYQAFVAGVDFTPGVTTTLTLARAPGTPGNLLVHFDGVFQANDQWGVSGTTLTFNSPIPSFVTKVYARIGTTLSVDVPPDRSVGDEELQWGTALGRVVNSIADLRALTKVYYQRAFALGYYGVGDGGGGAYYLDSSDTTTPDDGGTVIVATDGGRWKLKITGAISVRQFGAKGDASVDDTAAINAAILAVEARGGGTVYFPATDYNNGKWYRCDGTIYLSATRDVELLGEGNTMVKSHATSSLIDLLVVGDPLDVSNRPSWVKLNNLKLWSNTGTNGNGIRAIRVNNFRVHNCSVYNHGVNGGYFSDTYTFHMEDSEFVGNVNGSGLRLTNAGGNNSSITRSKFNSNGTAANLQGIRVEGLQYNVIIDKCDFEFNYQGILADSTHALSISDNYFEGNVSAAVYIPPGSTCRGVTLSDNAVLNTYFDINSVAGVSVFGNVFEAAGNVLNINGCTEVDLGTNSYPGGGTISTDNNGHTDFSALGTWVAYTPTWASSGVQPSIGNGVIQGFWKRIGKTCHVRIRLLAGSTTTFGTGSWLFSLPFASVNVGQAEWYGMAKHNNGATTKIGAIIPVVAAGVSNVTPQNAADATSVTATSPATWASGDALQMNLTYETA